MRKETNRTMRIVQVILGLLMLSSFLFLIIGEVALPSERDSEKIPFMF